jgi:beta-lactam-binding protein with PASTA domain
VALRRRSNDSGHHPASHARRVGLLVVGATCLVVVGVALAITVPGNGSAARLVSATTNSTTTTTGAGTAAAVAGAGTTTATPNYTETTAPAKIGTVPNLIGEQVAQAERQLQSIGYSYQTTTVQTSGSLPPVGSVITQQPAAGSLLPNGSVIALSVVTSGSTSTTEVGVATTTTTTGAGVTTTTVESIVVPNVLGEPVVQAERQLQSIGYAYQTTPVQSSGSQAGSVLTEQPMTGSTLPIGSTVSLGVAS